MGKQEGEKKQESEKRKTLESALEEIQKRYGKGAIMRLGESKAVEETSVIPTGSLSLDLALGVRGYPRGRIVEVFGPEASGKTTLALHAVAEAQAQGGVAAFIDAEHALDIHYAKKVGVKTEDLYLSQPDTGEQALEIAEHLVRSGAVDLIVVDSVAALVPRMEIEGEMGEVHVGVQARLMSQALRKLTAAVFKSQTCLLFINQVRMKIGQLFGNPETTPGGLALKFYASVRLEIRRVESLKDGEGMIGSRVRVRVVKNKMAPPFKEAEFDLLFGEGISRCGELLDLGVEQQLIEKNGSFFTYGKEKVGQGREQARALLKENLKLAHEIEEKLRETCARK